MSTNTPDTPETSGTPETPGEHTEVLHPTEHTEALPTAGRRPAEHPVAEPQRTQALATQAPAGAVPPLEAPPVVRGPYVAPVILGLVCLVIAAAAFAQEIANWTINWGDVGPLGIVIAGVVLVLLGGLGLLSSRRRRR